MHGDKSFVLDYGTRQDSVSVDRLKPAADWPTGQSPFLMTQPDVSLVNILLSITRVSLVQNKFVFCQLRVSYSTTVHGTIIDGVLSIGESPLKCFFIIKSGHKGSIFKDGTHGDVDSI